MLLHKPNILKDNLQLGQIGAADSFIFIVLEHMCTGA